MLLMGALCALLVIGIWLYCLVDILLTPREDCRRLPKAAWLAIVMLTFTAGAAAWLLLGRRFAAAPRRPRRLVDSHRRFEPARRAALARSRHPAGRSRPVGPDDDLAFLDQLDQMIRGGRDTGNEF